MNNEQIKQLLISIEPVKSDFTVTLTGKESKKVNGFYKPDTHEIFLHNKNFKNENQLIYTAIHEYTHHLIQTEREEEQLPLSNGKEHNTYFWAKMDKLLEIAIEKGFYVRNRSEKLKTAIKAASELDCQIAKLQQELGKILTEIKKLSVEEGERFEDIITHDVGIKQSTAKNCITASTMPENIICGQDKQDVFIKAKNKPTQIKEKLIKAVEENKSVEQLKAISNTNLNQKNTSNYDRLKKEKVRLEKTLSLLNQRYLIVCETLEAM